MHYLAEHNISARLKVLNARRANLKELKVQQFGI